MVYNYDEISCSSTFSMNSTTHHSVPNKSGLHELPSKIIGETLSFENQNEDSSTYQYDTVENLSLSTDSFYSDIF